MAHDRVEKDHFALTKAGLITYQRGRLTVIDRSGLEAASCECCWTATEMVQQVTTQGSTRPKRG